MRDFAFAEAAPRLMPTHNRSTLVIAAVLHALLFAVLIQVKTKPVRVSSTGSPQGGIAAYVAGPIGAAPAAAPKPAVAKTALKTEVAKNAGKDDRLEAGTAAGAAGVVGADQAGSGPVRLGSGGDAGGIVGSPGVLPAGHRCQ